MSAASCRQCGCADDRRCDTADLCTACVDRSATHELAATLAEATVHGGEPSAIDQLAREVLTLVQERDAARALQMPTPAGHLHPNLQRLGATIIRQAAQIAELERQLDTALRPRGAA